MTTWKDSLERRDEVKAAFLEGVQAGADGFAELEAWDRSEARKKLERPLEEKPE